MAHTFLLKQHTQIAAVHCCLFNFEAGSHVKGFRTIPRGFHGMLLHRYHHHDAPNIAAGVACLLLATVHSSVAS